jgi:hypothetical protein
MAYIGKDSFTVTETVSGSRTGSVKNCPKSGKLSVTVRNLGGNKPFRMQVYLYDKDVTQNARLGMVEFVFEWDASNTQTKSITLPANDDFYTMELFASYLWNSEVSSSVEVDFNHYSS